MAQTPKGFEPGPDDETRKLEKRPRAVSPVRRYTTQNRRPIPRAADIEHSTIKPKES